MDADGLSAGLVANDAESIKALIGNCPAWIECFPSYSEKAAKGVDDAVQAVKAYRLEGKRVHREVIPGYLYETAKAAAAKTAGGADGGHARLDAFLAAQHLGGLTGAHAPHEAGVLDLHLVVDDVQVYGVVGCTLQNHGVPAGQLDLRADHAAAVGVHH